MWAQYNTPLRLDETVFDKSARRKSLGKQLSSANRRESINAVKTIRRVDRMINDAAANDMDTSMLYREESPEPEQPAEVVKETLVNLVTARPVDTSTKNATIPNEKAPATKRPLLNNISQENGLKKVHALLKKRKKRKFQDAVSGSGSKSKTKRLSYLASEKALKRINLTRNKVFDISVRDNGENDKYDDSLTRARHAVVVGRKPNTINLRTRKPVSVKWDSY